MKKIITCIVCPNGCDIEVTVENGKVVSCRDSGCKRGDEYVAEEITTPRRTIASLVPVEGGELPLTSVRTTNRIPKDKIMDAMAEIRKVKLQAPVRSGQVVIANLLNCGSDVIVTKDVS